MYHVRIIKDDIVVEDFLSPEPVDSNKERQLLQNREDHWIDVSRVPHQPEDFFPEEEFYESDFDECE